MSLLKGKALFRIISRSPPWKHKLDDFRRFSGASIERGRELTEMSTEFHDALSQLSPSIREASLTDRMKFMDIAMQCFKELPSIRDKLRHGGSKRLEEEIVDTLMQFWENLDRRSNTEAELLAKMETVAGFLDLSANAKGGGSSSRTSAPRCSFGGRACSWVD